MPNLPPSSKRERLARFISRIRSKRTSGSSLVVQTGFPTSLADLVVKNRAKFKKRKKPSHSSNLDSNASVAVPSEHDSAGDLQALAVQIPYLIDDEIQSGPVSAPVRRRRGWVGLGFAFLMVKVAALVVLPVGRKWFVAGITVLTFGLLVLEFCGFLTPRSTVRNVIERFDSGGRRLVSPIREVEDHQNSECLTDMLSERWDFDEVENANKDHDLLRRRSNKRNCVETVTEGFYLRGRELASPIRETESETHQNSLRSERTSDTLVQSEGLGNPAVLNSKNDIFLESIVIGAVGNITKNQDLGNPRKSKRKNLFRKLFKRKNHKKKDESESTSSFDGSRVANEEVIIGGEEGDDVKENSDSDEEFFSCEAYDDDEDIDAEDSNIIQDKGGEIRLVRWRKLLFFIVVLLGLLGGKGLALISTVAWYILCGCTGTVWKKWKMQ